MNPARMASPASLLVLSLLGGCASSLSGIGGSESLSCKAPEGVICTSVSGVYANSASITARGTPLPAFTLQPATDGYVGIRAAPRNNDFYAPNGNSGNNAAQRTGPRVLRLWLAPWEDSDGDLHDESTVHVLIDNGRWLIDPIRPSHKNRLDAVKPPAIGNSQRSTSKPDVETTVPNESQPFGAVPSALFPSLPR